MKVIDNFIDVEFCNNLINDLNKIQAFNDNSKIVHGGRRIINNASSDWHNLKKKSYNWNKLSEKIDSSLFFEFVKKEINFDDKKFCLTKFFTKEKNNFSNRLSDVLNNKVKESNTSYILMAIIYKIYVKLKRNFIFFFNKFFKLKNSIELLIDLSIASKGYEREIHRDSDSRVIVFLLFLNMIDDDGGKFNFFTTKKNIKEFPFNPSEKNCTLSSSIDPAPGKLIIFKNKHNAYHSVSKMMSNNKRYFIYGSYTQLVGKFSEIKNFSSSSASTEFNTYL